MEGTETTVETLQNGECLLVDARIVRNGKISLQFAEIIRPIDEQMSLVAYSNRYDDSFSTKARRSWLITDPQAATEDYRVDFTDTGDWYEGPKGGNNSAPIPAPPIGVVPSSSYAQVPLGAS